MLTIAVFVCILGHITAFPLHASCKLDWSFQMSCSDVQQKLVDQINAWHTADNCPNGAGEKCLYTLSSQTSSELKLEHETPKHHYTDTVTFNFAQGDSADTCKVHGYSTSQTWYAVLDYSTNYCNMRNLLEDHKEAVDASKQWKAVETAVVKAASKSEEAVTAALRNTYFAAKQHLPSSIVPDLNNLCIRQGVTQLNDLRVDSHTTYEHNTSIEDFQDSIMTVINEDIMKEVKQSRKFSLMIDESTDISVKQNLVTYIRVLTTNNFGVVIPATYFLGINELFRADAESIYTKVVDLLYNKDININGLCGISTDGASVMVGHKSGVVKRLKDTVPGVLATHCIAHRLALSCCTGADTIPYLVKYQEILNSIYKFFRNSPKNTATLSAIQRVLDVQSNKVKEVFHTRWLSFEGSVDAILTNYSSLVSVFLQETSGKALSLYKPITCYKFLYVSHFMADCLKPLAILSRSYQKENINYSEVTPLLSSTIETLEELRDESNGENLNKFVRAVPAEPQLDTDGLYTFEFGNHTIRDGGSQRNEATKVCKQFVSNVVKSLNVRFADNNDSAVLTALSNFFNPLVNKDSLETDLDTIVDYLTSFGFEGSKSELKNFLNYKQKTIEGDNKSISDILSVCNLAIRNKDLYPAAAEAAERLLVAPVSTVDCERGFSQQNIIKTKLRNSLTSKSLDRLMFLAINGPAMEKFDFSKSFSVWAMKKNRRILN